jgi:hypothetical protein
MLPEPDGTTATTEDTTATDDTTTDDATTTDASADDTATTDTTATTEDTPEAKYTDADLDHHKGNARKEGRSAVLSKLGFKKLEDAEAWVKQQREGETRADEVLSIANRRIVKADAREVAAEVGVKKNRVDDIVTEFLDLSDIEVSDDGEADRETIKTRITEFTTKYPEFLKSSTGKPPGEKEGDTVPTGIDAKIAEAQEAGNFVLAERLQAQKLAATKKK